MVRIGREQHQGEHFHIFTILVVVFFWVAGEPVPFACVNLSSAIYTLTFMRNRRAEHGLASLKDPELLAWPYT